MPFEELRKQWDAHGSCAPVHAALRFVDDWLVLGAGTRLALAKRGGPATSNGSTPCDEARIGALLGAAYERPLSAEPGNVKYDGCVDPDGPMLDAKANFEQFLDKRSKGFQSWFRGANGWPEQLHRQSDAGYAAGIRVEWHVQKKPVADYIRELASLYKNVTVIWDPWP